MTETYATAALVNKVTEALMFTLRGRRVRFSKILPRTASTDGWQATANQSMPSGTIATTFAASRRQFNNALRFVDMVTRAVAGETLAGVTTTGLYAPIDPALLAEANDSGVLTPGGGERRVPMWAAVPWARTRLQPRSPLPHLPVRRIRPIAM